MGARGGGKGALAAAHLPPLFPQLKNLKKNYTKINERKQDHGSYKGILHIIVNFAI